MKWELEKNEKKRSYSTNDGDAAICSEFARELNLTGDVVRIDTEGEDYCLEYVGEHPCEDPRCEDCRDPLYPIFCHPDAFRLYGPGIDGEGILVPDVTTAFRRVFDAEVEDHVVHFSIQQFS